jgi:AcrR family transcriptional regulator
MATVERQRKGEVTRQAILERALGRAAIVGLDGISIGALADDLGLSKAGLFAHFGSKEALQLDIIRTGVEQFVTRVLTPAFKAARGEPRIRALFKEWMRWGGQDGGCIFIAASFELDDQPGAVREAVLQAQRDFVEAIAAAVRIAVEERHFRADLEPMQFAHEMFSIGVGCHVFARLMRDPGAVPRTYIAFERLISSSKKEAP